MEDYKNYQSVNQTENAAEKAWSVSVKRQKTIQQATLTLNNGKAYKYASRYPVADGNVAIVGNILAYQIDKDGSRWGKIHRGLFYSTTQIESETNHVQSERQEP